MINENLILYIFLSVLFCCSVFLNGSVGANLDTNVNAEVKLSFEFGAASQIEYSYNGSI